MKREKLVRAIVFLLLIKTVPIFFGAGVVFSEDEIKKGDFFELESVSTETYKKFNVSFELGYQTLTNATPIHFGTKKQGTGLTVMGALFLGGEYFLDSSLSAILQGMMVFQMGRSNTLLRGYDIGTRYYLFGVGSSIEGHFHDLNYNLKEDWRQFVEIFIGRRDYQISAGEDIEDPYEGEDFYQGSYYQVIVGFGTVYTWSKDLDLSIRIGYAPMSFASTGDRVVLQEMSFLLGMVLNVF